MLLVITYLCQSGYGEVLSVLFVQVGVVGSIGSIICASRSTGQYCQCYFC